MKQRLFVDMDGTLNEWSTTDTMYEICQPGYFAHRPVQQNILLAVMELTGVYDVYILSSVFADAHSIQDKNEWLDEYFDIPESHRIYVPCGEPKSKYVPNPRKTDILLDDFSVNLHEWHGIGVKVKNGINGTKGTWHGFELHINQNIDCIVETIKAAGQLALKENKKTVVESEQGMTKEKVKDIFQTQLICDTTNCDNQFCDECEHYCSPSRIHEAIEYCMKYLL